jgi:hypothetical protein
MLVFLSLLTLTVRYLSQSSTTTLSTFFPVGDGKVENGQSSAQLGQLNDDDAGNNVINILHLDSDDEIDDEIENDAENEDIKWSRMKDYNTQMSLIEECCNPTSSSTTSSSSTSSSFNNNIITIRSSSSPTTVIQR